MKRQFLIEYMNEEEEGSKESTDLIQALEYAIEKLEEGCEVWINEYTGGQCKAVLETCSIESESYGG